MIKKFILKPLKRLLKDKIRGSRFSKEIFRSFYLRKALVFPSRVDIETTSFCNAQCIHCEHRKLKRPFAHMEMDLYKKIIDECYRFRKYCKIITPAGTGEPLLDPTFFEKVNYAKQKNNFFITIYSNGSLLTPINCQKLIDSKIDKITFSVDGATKESFEKIRVGLSYENVTEGIKRLIDLKRKLNVKTPKIGVYMAVTPYNVNEIDLFKKTWRGVADSYFVKTMHVWGGNIIDKDLISYSHQHLKKHHNHFTPCFYLWKGINIAQDGRIALCCIDAHIQEDIGNLNKESIWEIWHGEKFNRIRKMHLSGKMGDMFLCRGCNFREIKEYPWWWYVNQKV